MAIDPQEITLRLFVFLLLAAVVFAAQEPNPTAPPTPAPALAKPTSGMRRAVEWRRFDYTCAAGEKVIVYLHNDMVKVRFKEQLYFLKRVSSADGEKYSDGKVVWWGVGNGGFLQEDSAEGNGPMMAKDCKLDKPMSGGVVTNTVTGTVSYMVRMALPPTAVIEVKLQEVSLADAPAKVLAEEKITLGERQVPVPFSLTFDPAKIEQNHIYSVSARITVDGGLRFMADQSFPVITRGNPKRVELILKPVPASVPAKP